MADISLYMTCNYCKKFAVKKYHNTYYQYCGNCSRDSYGEEVSICGYCGVAEPESRMTTEIMCDACWWKDIEESNYDKIKVV